MLTLGGEIIVFKKLVLIGLVSVALISFASEQTSPAGLWKTHDDKGKPTGYVRMLEDNGIYTGLIEKGLETDKEEQFCNACKDERKNQKLIGMTMMKNVKAKGGVYADVYEGTEILDPFSGNTYRVKLTLKDAGKKMEVRGFVGVSLFRRTQIWDRAE